MMTSAKILLVPRDFHLPRARGRALILNTDLSKLRQVLSCLVICTGQHSNGVKRSGMGRMV